MTDTTSNASLEAALSVCKNSPDIRVLRRVTALEEFSLQPRGELPTSRIGIVDTETTGTDPLIDEIIDVAVVILDVDHEGEIVGIASAAQALRDPGMPIPTAITRLTGIADSDVSGRTIDLGRLERRLASADVLIGHNCSFDAAFLEQLVPGMAGAAWACSAKDFDWSEAGFDGRKLGHLLMQIGRFADAHRAMSDVVSLIHLLAHRLPRGTTVLRDLLANAARRTIRFEATGAAYERRGWLKARGYQWDARNGVWWREIGEDECAAEQHWFRETISPAGRAPRMTPVTWNQRHR